MTNIEAQRIIRERGIVAVNVTSGWPPKFIGATYAALAYWRDDEGRPVMPSDVEQYVHASRMPIEDVEVCARYLAGMLDYPHVSPEFDP